MNLTEKLTRAAELSGKHPSFVEADINASTINSLNKSIDKFLNAIEIYSLEDNMEYSELLALLNDPKASKKATLAWMKSQLKEEHWPKKRNTKLFAVTSVKHGYAPKIIKNLQNLINQSSNDFVHCTSLDTDQEIEDFIKTKYKGKALTDFCKDLDIKIGRNSKNNLDRKKTIQNVINEVKKTKSRIQ